MKLSQFSLKNIVVRTEQVVKRFPLAILACVIGTVAGIVLIHADEPGEIPNLLLTITLAAPLFISLALVSSAKRFAPTKRWVVAAGILALSIGYFFVLPDLGEAYAITYERHVMWALGFILLITFIPFTTERGKEIILAFWQYNRELIFALVLTGIWAVALQAGVSIAMGSIDFLFDIDIPGERYLELWVILVGTFSPLFFLNRLPAHPEKHDTTRAYPKEVRLFSQFVLVPLVTAYFLILYAYTFKILLTMEWPEGQLAYMILGFSFLGVLTYLALYPLRDSVAWIKHAGTILFAAMIPQVFMLFAALWIRVEQYAITENRYFVFIFGCWLLAMAVYYLVSKSKDIRVIPATIFVLAFLTSFGPWGAFAVSEASQINRLEGMLVENGLLVDGTIVPLPPFEGEGEDDRVSYEDHKEISAVVRYLNQVHGLDGIQPWFEEDLKAIVDEEEEKYYRTTAEVVVVDLMGLKYTYSWGREVESVRIEDGFFTLHANALRSAVIPTNGYSYLLHVDDWYESYQEGQYVVVLNEDASGIVMREGEEVLIEFSLQTFLAEYAGSSNVTVDASEEYFQIPFGNDRVEGVLFLESIYGEVEGETYQVDGFTGFMFFSPAE